MEAALAPVSASLGAACGEQYSLYRRHPASDSWTTEATQLQVPAESCSEYIYAMTVTVEAEVNGFELKTGEVNTMCEVSFDTGGGGPVTIAV